jgi:hypothetical protein
MPQNAVPITPSVNVGMPQWQWHRHPNIFLLTFSRSLKFGLVYFLSKNKKIELILKKVAKKYF